MTALEYFQAKLAATISPLGITELQAAHPESLLIIDVRVGPVPTMIPGAIRIPQTEIVERLTTLPKDKLLVLYCWETWCSLAAKASVPLLQAGYVAKELYGGIAAWEALHLPTEIAERPTAIRCDC